ncbi:MAG: glutamate-5-semialdehyde dehydrogenase, partial [Nitrospira sp.]|nr:glutamate-5-semialdehyde dehydrogenase [Nitrospira sp.]
MPAVPVKLYIEKLLRESRNLARALALVPGPVKDSALRAMADELEADAEAIVAANMQDVEVVAKSQGGDVGKDRMKELIARVRVTADSVREMADRLR